MKKFLRQAFLLGAAIASALTFTAPAEAAENILDNKPAFSTVAPANNDATAEVNGYMHVSKRYGYAILCLQKPDIIPASVFYEDGKKKGEVLLYDFSQGENGYNTNHAWVVLVNAFTDAEIPDLNALSEAEANAFVEKFLKGNIYSEAVVTNISEDNKGLVAITARELDVDSDGDGVPDTTVVADHQEIATFFRSGGKCYEVILIDRPEITDKDLTAYQMGVAMFKSLEQPK